MRKKSKLKSDACEAIYSSALGLYSVGTIDARKLRQFKLLCLTRYPTDRVRFAMKKQTRF